MGNKFNNGNNGGGNGGAKSATAKQLVRTTQGRRMNPNRRQQPDTATLQLKQGCTKP